jgi:hypothetical protein
MAACRENKRDQSYHIDLLHNSSTPVYRPYFDPFRGTKILTFQFEKLIIKSSNLMVQFRSLRFPSSPATIFRSHLILLGFRVWRRRFRWHHLG